MKQLLSEDQLRQLGMDEWEFFTEWLSKAKLYHGYFYETVHECVTIGALIQFIAENIDRSTSSFSINAGEHQWYVLKTDFSKRDEASSDTTNLIDGLWNTAVPVIRELAKQMLAKKNESERLIVSSLLKIDESPDGTRCAQYWVKLPDGKRFLSRIPIPEGTPPEFAMSSAIDDVAMQLNAHGQQKIKPYRP